MDNASNLLSLSCIRETEKTKYIEGMISLFSHLFEDESPGSALLLPREASERLGPDQREPEESKPESLEQPGRSRALRRCKKEIAFRIKATQRHNVDKYIIRSVMQFHVGLKNEILQEFAKASYTVEDFEKCSKKFKMLQKAAKDSNKGKRTIQDYAHTIDILLSTDPYTIILKVCLEYCLTQLENPRLRTVQEKNLSIYPITIADYLAYLNTLLMPYS